MSTGNNASILADPPANLYTWVDFPRYGGDYFLNAVLTSSYWYNIQSNRALRTQNVIYYGDSGTTNTTLYCTNMYGTYSISQMGAHEGIDFVYGSIRNIYAAFEGDVLSDGLSHQLAVYDEDSPGPKTYNYLHMNSKSVGASVQTYSMVGQQGMQGNADGYHVHFEVHSGSTIALSFGSDHVLGSISPYQLQSYIGE